MRVKINHIFEWIPYDQFNDVKRMGKYGSDTVYSAVWKKGPFFYDLKNQEYTRTPSITTALKCLGNSQNVPENLNEV
jgi:hypothetical protein